MDAPRIAVLTGDLVGSSQLTAQAVTAGFRILHEAAADIALWTQVDAPTHFTRNRGDGWQLVLARCGVALRAALHLRAALRAAGPSFSTRIAIAAGPGSLPDSADLNAATGPVYVASGRALDGLTGRRQMVHAGGGALGAATRLADHLSQSWTPAQARAVHPLLRPRQTTHARIAASLGITRQAVDQALAAAGFHALAEALDLIEAADAS